jgi:glycine/D-amino acid oxidase-like deaminating enzyme
MTTAYLLAREGKSVVVVDKNAIAGGETAPEPAVANSVSNSFPLGVPCPVQAFHPGFAWYAPLLPDVISLKPSGLLAYRARKGLM